MNYYNENEPHAAAWLRELIRTRRIPDGFVDERSIVDVKPHELTRYTQQHFFAGIGGWPLALRLAGWPDNKPVRTGSCPCQPFAAPGKRLGTKDKRHLWPYFRDLITFGQATITFGEQVASPLGREWLAGVRADLENLGYEVGAADLCAACIGAPHIRQRLYWVANRYGARMERQRLRTGSFEVARQGWKDIKTIVFNLGPFHGRKGFIEPVIRGPLNGIPGGLGRLRGYGNAIVPQIAAEFIQAAQESITK